MLKYLLILCVSVLSVDCLAYGDDSYEVPPSYETDAPGAYLSPSETRDCVILYNQAINGNAYATDAYNSNCASRTPYDPCAEANKLNRERGLPETPCY